MTEGGKWWQWGRQSRVMRRGLPHLSGDLGDEKAAGLRIRRGGGEGKGKGEQFTFFCYKLVTIFSEIKAGRRAGSSCQ